MNEIWNLIKNSYSVNPRDVLTYWTDAKIIINVVRS